MSSTWGKNIKISIFGESHGTSIGVVVDGLPSGLKLDEDELLAFMSRRAPGKASFSTPRKEKDLPKIQSGLFNGCTTGTPLCAIIENTNTQSKDYAGISGLARPSHADYTGFMRYNGYNDQRGSGHFSGRLTAPLVFAGGIAKQILAKHDIFVGGHIASIKNISDNYPDSLSLTADMLKAVAAKPFPVFDDAKGTEMIAEIEKARLDSDSIGGIMACYALGVPVGIGSPMFGGVENVIASLLFGVPAVKGVEFGAGFASTKLTGSENNDAMRSENGKIFTLTNNHGGIIGGISSGMPIVVRAAVKPTPSISKVQQSIDYLSRENTDISTKGRHDPCILPRAVPCAEACVALAVLDLMFEKPNSL